MVTIRRLVGLPVFLATVLVPVVLCAQPAQDPCNPPQSPPAWACPNQLGDVFVASGSQVKVFGHGGGTQKETAINIGATVSASAFDAGLNLFVATQANTVVEVDRSSHSPNPVPIVSGLPAAATAIVFDADGNFYLGLPGSPGTIRRYDLAIDPDTLARTFALGATYQVLCDASVGLWMDLAPERPDDDDADLFATQRMYYTCGGRDVRYFDVLAATVDNVAVTSLFINLPNPGVARDLRLLPPKPGDPADAGGLVVADDRNVKLVNSLKQLVGTFDVASINGFSSVEFSPIAGSLWAAQNDSRVVYRFRLPANPFAPFAVTQTEAVIASSNFTAPIASLAVNGGYRSATSTRLLRLNSSTPKVTATYLDHTDWVNSWELTAGPNFTGDVRIAATLHEGGAGVAAPDLNLSPRLSPSFSSASPINAYRGRAAFVRAVVQTSSPAELNFSQVTTLVTMNYIFPTFPNGLLRSVLLDDPDPVSYVGFTDEDKFAIVGGRGGDITREFFQTQETLRGGTKGLNDFLVAFATDAATFKTSIVAPTGVKTFQIGNPITIRVKTSDKSATNHCPDMVLTVSRALSADLADAIVGSSEPTSTLKTSRGLPAVFTSVSGNVCQTNFITAPNSSEVPGTPEVPADFQPGRTYNFCANYRRQQPDEITLPGAPFNDVCGTFKLTN